MRVLIADVIEALILPLDETATTTPIAQQF
jgi:hypothetical protein